MPFHSGRGTDVALCYAPADHYDTGCGKRLLSSLYFKIQKLRIFNRRRLVLPGGLPQFEKNPVDFFKCVDYTTSPYLPFFTSPNT